MLAGMSASEKKVLNLTNATDYYYLMQVRNYVMYKRNCELDEFAL